MQVRYTICYLGSNMIMRANHVGKVHNNIIIIFRAYCVGKLHNMLPQ